MTKGKDFEGLDFNPSIEEKTVNNVISIRANSDNIKDLNVLKAQHVNVSGWVNELISNGFKHTRRLSPQEISRNLKDFRPVNLLVHKSVAVLLERALAFNGSYEVGKFLSVLLSHQTDFIRGDTIAYGVTDEKFVQKMEHLDFTLKDQETPRTE